MDLNYLYKRQQVSLFHADNAACDRSRRAHRAMTDAYVSLLASARSDTSRTVGGFLKNGLSEKTMTAFPERNASTSQKPALPLSESAREPLATKSASSEPDALAHYGISAVTLMCYEWGGYRYSNAKDAIAAAKRGASK